MSEEPKAKGGWWMTLPGVLTALAGFITAVAGLIVALHQIGFAIKPSATDLSTEKSVSTEKGAPSEKDTPGKKRKGSTASERESEIQIGAGEIVYKVLGTRIEHQAEGRRALRVRIDIACHQSYPCYFGTSDFRLLVNAEQRAPIDGPNEAVPSNSTKQGIAVFEIPEGADRAEFEVVNHGDPYKIPIDLKR
jgi:hypothetical protein